MKIVNMKLTPAEAKEEIAPDDPQPPAYPWGLELQLDTETLEKLGLGRLDAGTSVMIAGTAKVTGWSEHEREGSEKRACLSLQITELGVEAPGKSLADKMYGGS